MRKRRVAAAISYLDREHYILHYVDAVVLYSIVRRRNAEVKMCYHQT